MKPRAAELGVGDRDLIITYDDYYGIFAARVAWAFRYYGAEARVLDGGWTSWTETGRPVGTETVAAERREFVVRQRCLSDRCAVLAGADRDPRRRDLRRLLQRVEHRSRAARRVRARAVAAPAMAHV